LRVLGLFVRAQDLLRMLVSFRCNALGFVRLARRLARSDLCYHVNAMSSPVKAQSPGHDAERERVIALLRAHAEDIRGRGVTRLALFGSTARGEAGPSSDVDLLIEVDPHARFTLVDLAGLERFLTGLLLRPVEFAFPSRLRERPRIWRRVQADALDVL
jgi:uncharacterized protein